MKNKPGFFFAMAVLTGSPLWSADSSDVHFDRPKISAYTDLGQIVSGHDTPDNSNSSIDFVPLNRISAIMTQRVTLGENFEIFVGGGALMWYPFETNPSMYLQRLPRWLPRISIAEAKWTLGGARPWGTLELGYFPYKYNPDATNLGEYLYRSNAYPGVVSTTDGFTLMNAANVYGEGAHFSVNQFHGALQHNLTLFVERTSYPVGDLSPGYDFAFHKGILDFGGGAVFQHYLSLKPSHLKPDVPEDEYVRVPQQIIDTPQSAYSVPDTIPFYQGPRNLSPDAVQSAFGAYPAGDAAFQYSVLHRYTTRGIKLMARMAMDFGFLLPPDIRGREDLRVFSELAVLGVQNQPYYYDDIRQRIPVMFGINLPTFRLLDKLAVQGEYYASPFSDINDYFSNGYPVWTVLSSTDQRDDWKWSVYAKRSINKLCSVYVQVADDYLRLPDYEISPVISETPLTRTPTDWYYLVRFEVGI